MPVLIRRDPLDPAGVRKKLTLRIIVFSTLFILITLLVWLGYLVVSVKSSLEQGVQSAHQLKANLENNDTTGADEILRDLQNNLDEARRITDLPLWRAAGHTPLVGDNFAAVTEVTVSSEEIVTHAVIPLYEKFEELDSLIASPINSRIALEPIKRLRPIVEKAERTIDLSYSRIEQIDSSGLLPAVSDPLETALLSLSDVKDLAHNLSTALVLIPPMLGDEAPRKYLVLIQNSAELRSTGGIPGALAVIRTEDGTFSMTNQSSASKMGIFNPPIPVDTEQEDIYSARLGRQMQNVNLTPDFPTAASTAKKMWEHRYPGETIDGVLAIDPTVLAHLLKATGSVELTDPNMLEVLNQTSLPTLLTAENVVSTLLSDVYREIEDPSAQDEYFAAVADLVFTAFAEGQGDAGQLIKALNISAEESRLLLWSAHPQEQDSISATSLSGAVSGTTAGGAAFGVYFNDATGAKMDFYALRTVQLLQACDVDGYHVYNVRITAQNKAPLNSAESLPRYVTGGGVFGVTPGHIRTNYVVYGPTQSFVEAATVNGEPVNVGSGKHNQRPVGSVQMEVAPGETAVLDLTFSRVPQDSDPRLLVTPTVQSPQEIVRQFERLSCK